MTPERYQRIKELFHSALERAAEERPAFLAGACGDDTDLRAKVEALVAVAEQPGSFMDAPAYEVAAKALAEDSTASLVGQSIGRYQVMALLGSGGMGDVYLARDTRLGRKVALKLLPDYLTDDESCIRRFRQEARAASALNHPNVLTIYEIEEAGGRHFIATEFVEGETLRQHLKGGSLGPREALGVAAQIADALSKAHQAGIVHRDIKPENIMLDTEGRVKVLDFGLAKYTRPLGSAADDDDAGSVRTVPGMLMGTTAYMSPEQARGLTVDARTDIWSLGAVLYEMLAGRAPFRGQTPSDTLAAVLEREPEPLKKESSGMPDELQRIVSKALRKDREKRYQTSKDLALDLEGLRRGLEAQVDTGGAVSVNTAVRKLPPGARATRSRSLTALVLAAVPLLAAAAVIGAWAWRTPNPVTKGAAAPPPAAVPERSLGYSILVQKYRAGRPFQAPFRLAGEINFEKDYRVRLNLSSRQDGHLYILNEGPEEPGRASGYVILFPSPTANGGESRLGAGRQVQVPERSWLQFDAEQGTEKVWLVWSAESVPALEALKAYANPRDRGLVGDPGLNHAARNFLLTHQYPRPAASRDEDKKEVVLTANGAILTHLLRLEHH